MMDAIEQTEAAEMAAMQFAAGLSAAVVAELWERDEAWVLEAVRQALLETIPVRDGGKKAPRSQGLAVRDQGAGVAVQGVLEW